MLGLLGIGSALVLGIGMRAATAAGVVLYLMMWSVVLPPETNPVIDDHIIGAVTLVVLFLLNAGQTWGLGHKWNATEGVKSYPILK